MAIPYHTHNFTIQTAEAEEVIAGTRDDVPVTPKALKPALDLKVNDEDLAQVATSGSYDDLQDKPTLGSAAAADTTDFATAAEGALAVSALQPTTGVVRLPTFAYASTASGLADVQRLFVEDRRAHFARVDTEPTHGVKFENDGWWSLDELTVTPFMAGAAGDNVADDTGAVSAIVQYAKLTGAPIYAPDADFKTTESIADLHNVVWTGPGRIRRGSDVWRVSPTGNDTNTIYVSNSGDNANDGLSASEPKLTLQNALDQMILHRRPHLMNGYWKIVGAAGTYARVRFPDEGLPSYNPIEIAGPDVGGHPNVPTMIISEGSNGVSAVGVRTRERTETLCRDIHFIGFNGTSSSAGYDGNYYCLLSTVNCHFTNCTWGVSGGTQTTIDIKGGIFDGNGFTPDAAPYSAGGNVRGLFGAKFEIGVQGAGTRDGGPIFRNHNFGVFAQEHTNGHVDWCTFESGRTHVRLNYLSRLNLDGSDFKKATIAALWGEYNSVAFISSATSFGTGADANLVPAVMNGGSEVVLSGFFVTAPTKSATSRRIVSAIADQNISTTSSTVFHTLSLKAGMWADGVLSFSAIKKLRFRGTGILTGTAGYKRILARFGSTPVTVTFGSTETGKFEFEGHVLVTPSDQHLFARGLRHLATNVRLDHVRATEALTSDTTFNLEGLVENAADTLTITEFEVFVDGL